jgi:hypothetical protein
MPRARLARAAKVSVIGGTMRSPREQFVRALFV